MSDFRNDPNFVRNEMHDYDTRVQWAAVAVILLLVGGMIIAAAYTGGLSIVGESLLSHPGGNPCEIALGRTAGATAQTAGGGGAAMVVEDLGKVLGRAFHR